MQVCYPFTTVILRMSSEKESVSEALRVIVGKDGIPGTFTLLPKTALLPPECLLGGGLLLAGLWRGLVAGFLMAPRPGITFVVVVRPPSPFPFSRPLRKSVSSAGGKAWL